MVKEQDKVKYISDPKKINVLSKPLQKGIIKCFYKKPLTASEIAEAVSFPKDKIYYHIKKLVALDILYVAESEQVKGIVQKKFLPVAEEIKFGEIPEEIKKVTQKKEELTDSRIKEEIVEIELLEQKKEPKIKKQEEQEETEDKIIETVESQLLEDVAEKVTQDEEKNILLENLKKSRSRTKPDIIKEATTEIKTSATIAAEDEPKTKATFLRTISDRRRSNDRRDKFERRLLEERREKQLIDYIGKERRKGKEQRNIENRRSSVSQSRRIESDRRLNDSDIAQQRERDPIVPVAPAFIKKKRSDVIDNTLMHLKGMTHAMTFVHTGENVTFMQADKGLGDYVIKQVKNYQLPHEEEGQVIDTFPDLIKHVYQQSVDASKSGSQYLAYTSTDYNYEMTYIQSQTKNKDESKDFLFYNLNKSYALNMDKTTVDWITNDSYENNIVVCYSSSREKIERDYHALTANGIQPRYNTSIPKILLNIYNNSTSGIGGGNALLVYMVESKTYLALIQRFQLVDSRYFRIGLNNFILPLCKTFDFNGSSIHITSEMALDFLRTHGIAIDNDAHEDTGPVPWNNAQELLQTSVEMLKKELVNSNSYFTNVRRKIAKKSIYIDEIYVGGPGSHIKNMAKIIGNALDKPTRTLDELYMGYTKNLTIPKQQKRLARNQKALIRQRKKTREKLNRAKARVKDLVQGLKVFQDPGAMEIEMEQLMLNKKEKVKKLDLDQVTLEATKAKSNRIKEEYEGELSGLTFELEEMAGKLDQFEKNNLENHKELDLLINKVSSLENPEDAQSLKKLSELKFRILELEEQQQLIIKDVKGVGIECELNDGKIRNIEKAIELTVRDELDISAELKVKIGQRDEYEKNPWRSPVTTMSLKRSMEDENVDLTRKKKELEIDRTAKRTRLRDSKKRLSGLKRTLTPIQKDLDLAHSDLDDQSSAMVEISQACDHNERKLVYKESEFENSRQVHKVSLESIETEINKLERKNVGERIDESKQIFNELNEEKIKNQLQLTRIEEKFKLEMEQEKIKHDQMIKTQNKVKMVVEANREKILLQKNMLDQCLQDLETCHDISNILTYLQKALRVTADLLREPFSRDLLKVDGMDRSVIGSLSIAEQTIVWSKGRLPEYRKKLATRIAGGKNPQKRLNHREQKEIAIIGKILEAMDALIVVPDDLQKLRKRLSKFQDMTSDKHDLESKQGALQTNLKNIDQEQIELEQKLNGLARMAKKNADSIQINITRREQEKASLEMKEIKFDEVTATLGSLRKIQLEDEENNNTIFQKREETIDKQQIELTNLDEVKKELLKQQSCHQKAEVGSKEIEKSIQILRRRSINLEGLFQEKKDDKFRKNSELINRSGLLIKEMGALEKVISDEKLWMDQAKDRTADIKRQNQEWIHEKNLLKTEAGILKKQVSAYSTDAAEHKEKLRETIDKSIEKSELDESSVINAAEKKIEGHREDMLAELQALTNKENLIRKQLDDAIKDLKRLKASHENINRVLIAERKEISPKISTLNGELSNLENELETAQKRIHELRRGLKRKQAGRDRWKRRLSDETLAVAEKVANLNASIEHKKSDTYLSFLLEGLERVGSDADASVVARTIIQENILADQETIRLKKDSLRNLKVRSKDRLIELSIGIKNVEKDLNPITRKRNILLRKIRIKKKKIDQVKKPLVNYKTKIEQSASALNDTELNFLKFQQESENKLEKIAIARGEIQDSVSVAMDKMNNKLNAYLVSSRAKIEEMKKNFDADVGDVEIELVAILDGISSRKKDIGTTLVAGDKADEDGKAEVLSMAARKKTAKEMIKSHHLMIRVHKRDIKNIEQAIQREKKALSGMEKKFLSQMEATEKTTADLKEKQQSMEQDMIIREARISEIKKQNPGYEQDLKTLSKEIAELKKKNETLNEQQAKKENRFVARQVRLSDQLTILEQKRKGHEKILNTLNNDISDLEISLDQLEKKQESHDQRVQSLNQEKALALDKLQSIVQSLERNRKQARMTQIEVKNCLQGFKKSKEIRESVIPLVETMLDAKNVCIVDVNKDQNALQNVLRELEKRQKEKTASVRFLKQELSALNRKMKDLEKAYFILEQILQHKLNAGEVALNRIQTELAILEQEKRATIVQLKTLAAQHKTGMKAEEKNEKQFRMHISALEVVQNALVEEKAQIQRSVDLITASISDLNTRMEPMLTQNDELQKSHGRLEIDINALKTELQVIGVTIQDNINGIEKTDRVIYVEQKKLRQEEKDIKVSVRDLEIRLEAATKYIREQQVQLDAVIDKKKPLMKLLSDKEKELLKIDRALDETRNLFKDKRKLKKLVKRERTLTKDISRVERDIDRLQENYKALNRVLIVREQSAQENIKELEDSCSESELRIINRRKEIRDAEQKIKGLSKKLHTGPEKIKTMEKKLQKFHDDQNQLELKLKEIERGLDLIRKKINLIEEGGNQESITSRKQLDIDYMANMGLLLDPRARLNILPDEHKADFRFFVPNRILQAAMLVVITFIALVTFSRRSSLIPLETVLPQKTEQAAALDIKKQVYRDVLNDLEIIEGFHALLESDKVISDNIVSVLKYVSNAVPSEFKVTDLAVNNNVPYHRLDISITDKLEFEKKPLMSITLDGFLQMDGDRSEKVLRPFRSQLERDRQFKAVLFSEQDDGTRYKTPYIIDLIL